jgi:hypothetical protein
VKVFLSRDPLGVGRATPESLVKPFGRCIVHLDQECHVRREDFLDLSEAFALKIGP